MLPQKEPARYLHGDILRRHANASHSNFWFRSWYTRTNGQSRDEKQFASIFAHDSERLIGKTIYEKTIPIARFFHLPFIAGDFSLRRIEWPPSYRNYMQGDIGRERGLKMVIGYAESWLSENARVGGRETNDLKNHASTNSIKFERRFYDQGSL